MNKTVEIYFDDLTVEAQENLLEEFDTTKKKENWDVFPITVIDREVYSKDKQLKYHWWGNDSVEKNCYLFQK